jgi:hypothetical protein
MGWWPCRSRRCYVEQRGSRRRRCLDWLKAAIVRLSLCNCLLACETAGGYAACPPFRPCSSLALSPQVNRPPRECDSSVFRLVAILPRPPRAMAQKPRLTPLLLPETSVVPSEGRLTATVSKLHLERDDADWRRPIVLVNFQHNAESVSRPAEREGPGQFVWDHKAT